MPTVFDNQHEFSTKPDPAHRANIPVVETLTGLATSSTFPKRKELLYKLGTDTF